MAGEMIKSPMPFAILVLFVLGFGLIAEGRAGDSRAAVFLGGVLILVGIYYLIQYLSARKT